MHIGFVVFYADFEIVYLFCNTYLFGFYLVKKLMLHIEKHH